jgi:tetratricopeptide (TPR) repeat protein
MGKVQAAIQPFTAALGLLQDTQKNYARAELAVCHGKMGDHKRALELAEENLRGDPKDVTSLKIGASAAENLRIFSKAKDFARRILEILPEDEPTKKLLKRIEP